MGPWRRLTGPPERRITSCEAPFRARCASARVSRKVGSTMHSSARSGGPVEGLWRMLGIRRCRTVVASLAACAWLMAAAGSLPPVAGGSAATAVAASDPVIAAAGDIACDPASSKFNGGKGTSSACRQLATSNLVLADSTISAVLALGDNQYVCGGYNAYQQSFDPSWGRFLSIIHPVAGNHEYETSGGTDCSSGAAGY